ncbi:MAG: glycosyltransferase [Kiritimatiellae bacterium]|nr:glycosyltransferase [Kiritimatiellia bacterium]
MSAVHQLVAGFRRGDAIGNEAVRIRGLCAAHGVECRIWCPPDTISPEDRGAAESVRRLPAAVRPDDVALLHLSIGSEANAVFRALPCRRVVLYHNVTPPRYFERLAPGTAAVLRAGLREVRDMAGAAHANWAVSRFNAEQLREMGYADPKVFPLLVDGRFGGAAPDPAMLARLSAPKRDNLLFVGRFAPNKRHDRLLRVFRAYRRCAGPRSRLVVPGGYDGAETYHALLLGMAGDMGLRDVFFPGFVTDAELAACYATASAFVCTSDHEGFCAPLLEAMAWRVPVFAVAAGAVPETLDGAGVLFDPAADEATMAETIRRVLGDPALREAVLRKQDARLARFRARDEWAELKEVLDLP